MNEDDIKDVGQTVETDSNSDITSETASASSDVNVEDAKAASESSEIAGPELIVDIPEYTYDNPLPVFVVDEYIADSAAPFTLQDVYYGTISDTYLDYFEGIVQKLDFDTHYVCWRSGAYAYTMAYGDNLELSGSTFAGECDYVQIYRESSDYSSNWYVITGADSVSLDATNLFVYSDLGMFPTLERGFGTVEANMVLFSIGVLFVYSICHNFFDYILKRVFRR